MFVTDLFFKVKPFLSTLSSTIEFGFKFYKNNQELKLNENYIESIQLLYCYYYQNKSYRFQTKVIQINKALLIMILKVKLIFS